MRSYDVVIVGAGIAGMTAAIYVARAGKSVILLEERMHGGQIINTINIANWPAEPGISGAELSQKIYDQVNGLGVKVEYTKVLSIEQTDEYLSEDDAINAARKLFLVKTEDGDYVARAIVVATGTEPRRLGEKQLLEVGKRPISYCATCDGALFKDKPVVVVGSGNTAKHEIKYLNNIASKVYHIHHDDPIPEDVVAVFVAIGRVPNTDAVKNIIDLDESGYVVAGENCKTSVPGIFVAGDCRVKDVRQLVTAAGDGAVAVAGVLAYLT